MVTEKDEGDPISCPPGPYKVQPHHQGRLLFLTGAPGLGKSTTAQLLARLRGFVYYEEDCFHQLRNPYIPLTAESPTMEQEYTGVEAPLVAQPTGSSPGPAARRGPGCAAGWPGC